MNKKRLLIYLGIIAALIGVLIWSNFFMKEAYVLEDGGDDMSSTPKAPTLQVGEAEAKPDFFPQDIAADIVKTAEKYDYFYYLFMYPNKKIVLYNYNPDSILVEDSEKFHKAINDFVKEELYMTNYKVIFTTTSGAEIYKKSILDQYEEASYVPKDEDSKLNKKKMLNKKAKIDAVTDFYNECAKTMCIIDIDKMQYISIDKRNIDVAKKLLKDYKKW